MTLVSPPYLGNPSSHNAEDLPRIAIVGRGFTGMMTAIALLKGLKKPFHLVMFDPNPKIDVSEGVDPSATAVLNSRVRDLSVDPRARDDFQTWLAEDDKARERVETTSIGVENTFVASELFSAYVYQRFSEALRARTDVVAQVRLESAAAIDRHPAGGLSILGGDRQLTRFDAVFLASGYGLRERSEEPQSAHSVQDAVVIGGGVQAVDRALRLLEDAEALHVTLISASGFLPQSHTRTAVGRVTTDQPFPRTLRGAFRFLREAAEAATLEGSGWQGIMNGFRSRASDLWQGLTAEERRRFKRHVKAIYDSHRNRLPPEHYERLHQALAAGTITIKKGKVSRIARNGVLLTTPAGLEVFCADRVVDCRCQPSDVNSSLLRSVLSAGLARIDEVDLGLLVDRQGRAVTNSNEFQGLFAMGPLGLGSLPDIDLVPEIVSQSHAAAAVLNVLIGETRALRPSLQ